MSQKKINGKRRQGWCDQYKNPGKVFFSKHDDFEQILVIIFWGQADQGENWGEGTVGDCQ